MFSFEDEDLSSSLIAYTVAYASRKPTTSSSLIGFFRGRQLTQRKVWGARRGGEGRGQCSGQFVDQNPDPVGSETCSRIREKNYTGSG
jgi:hypothetical protein